MQNNTKEDVIIVDENDKIIWYKERWNMLPSDIYRWSALIIKNNEWKILLAQRSFLKKKHPWRWSFSAVWTNEKWETYLSNMEKEIKEEIWLVNLKLKEICKLRLHWNSNVFSKFFSSKLDKKIDSFILQKEEVESIRWLSLDEIEKGEFEWNKISQTLIKNLWLFK
jgi:isopentenyldiphosphate isomerase